MRRALSLVLVITSALSLIVLSTSRAASSTPRLRLQRGSFDARNDQPPTPSRALATPVDSVTIVQFSDPISADDRASLEKTGVTILEYLPDFAYLVRGSADQRAAAGRLPGIYATTPMTLADKLHPALLNLMTRDQPIESMVQIVAWPDRADTLMRDLSRLAITSRATLDGAQLQQVAALPSVRWIEPLAQPRLLNDRARTIMGVDGVQQRSSLYGAGQIVAVTDSGLDTGVAATLSPDFAGRIVATHVLAPGGDIGDLNGHGTHVAGSVAGAGVQSGANPATRQYAGSYAGVAPEAGLVIQAFEADANGEVIGLDPDYYGLFAQSYADGARIHTNSWGDITGPITDTEAAFGGYPFGSQRVDQFMWEHPDMTVLFAAGNSGADGVPGQLGFCTGGDGVVDPDSLLAPGTAKNVITVGASESDRAAGGLGATPWLLLSFCFSVQPLATDIIANNASGMAAFSSRGPTDDGRSKPDLVGPGTNIVSNRSHYPDAGALWGVHETNQNYTYSGGTSMATPLTAGASALVRQWLTLQGIANPSAAAVKAALLNTTRDIAPGQYGIGATQEIPMARPNSVAGWGRTDLGFIDAAAPYSLWIDDHTGGISTGSAVEYSHTANRSLTVTDSTQPLRVMLAWTDPPASLSASAQLVNDLDLIVTGPDGTQYRGNASASGDRVNNVEGVVIQNPPIGQYSVRVQGHNVPIATQPYALAVGGPLRSAATPTPTATTVPTATPTSTTVPTSTPTATSTTVPTSTPTATTTPPAPTGTPSATPPETPTMPRRGWLPYSDR